MEPLDEFAFSGWLLDEDRRSYLKLRMMDIRYGFACFRWKQVWRGVCFIFKGLGVLIAVPEDM